MTNYEAQQNMLYLVKKYASNRYDLVNLLEQDEAAAGNLIKFFLAEIDKEKKNRTYEKEDLKLVQSLFYLFY